MRESEPEKRRKSLIYIRLTNVQEHLYPHKGAFLRGSFFVARPAQKEENRLYIIILQRLRPIPRTGSGKQPGEDRRVAKRWAEVIWASENGIATFLARNTLFCCDLHRNLEFQMRDSSFPKRDKRRRMPFLAGAQPHEPVPRTGQGVQHVERRTMLRCNKTLHTSYKTRIGRFQAFKIAWSGTVLQRRTKLFHKMTLFQKAQIMRYILFIGFHFSRFFCFLFLTYNFGWTKSQGGPRERKAASRQKTTSPGVSDSGAR